MTKSLQKHKHQVVLTKTKPEILLVMSRMMGCDLHIHKDDTDIEILLKGRLPKEIPYSRYRLS